MLSKGIFRKSNKKGFTLIELLLVTALLPLVSFAVFANFSSGSRLWQALNRETPEEDRTIFMMKAEKAFGGAFKYSGIPFLGDSEKVSFAGAIESDGKLGGHGIGEIGFYHDASLRAVFKEEKTPQQLYKKTSGQKSLVLQGVESMRLSFFSFDINQHSFIWQGEWTEEQKTLPLAVRFELEMSDGKVLTRTFAVPTGG